METQTTTSETQLQVVERNLSIALKSPMWDLIGKIVQKIMNRNMAELLDEVNRAIEKGAKTDQTAADGNTASLQAGKAIKTVHDTRLNLTRPIRERCDETVQDEVEYCRSLKEAKEILDKMLFAKKTEDERKEREAQEEHDRQVREAQEAAKKREEHNKNISLGKGGTGEVAPVIPDIPSKPITMTGMRSTIRTKKTVNKDLVMAAINAGARQILGLRIFSTVVWDYEVTNSKLVPDNLKKISRG